MSQVWRVVERGLAMSVPRPDRDALLGDLEEQRVGAGARRVLAVLSVSLYYQAEPYRDAEARVPVAGLLLAGLALLWAVPVAAGRGMPGPDLYGEGVTRLLLAAWGASHLIGAVATGLLVGHSPLLPRWADRTRWHVALVLSVFAALGSPSGPSTVAAALLLMGAAWFGAAARVPLRST